MCDTPYFKAVYPKFAVENVVSEESTSRLAAALVGTSEQR